VEEDGDVVTRRTESPTTLMLLQEPRWMLLFGRVPAEAWARARVKAREWEEETDPVEDEWDEAGDRWVWHSVGRGGDATMSYGGWVGSPLGSSRWDCCHSPAMPGRISSIWVLCIPSVRRPWVRSCARTGL